MMFLKKNYAKRIKNVFILPENLLRDKEIKLLVLRDKFVYILLEYIELMMD